MAQPWDQKVPAIYPRPGRGGLGNVGRLRAAHARTAWFIAVEGAIIIRI